MIFKKDFTDIYEKWFSSKMAETWLTFSQVFQFKSDLKKRIKNQKMINEAMKLRFENNLKGERIDANKNEQANLYANKTSVYAKECSSECSSWP